MNRKVPKLASYQKTSPYPMGAAVCCKNYPAVDKGCKATTAKQPLQVLRVPDEQHQQHL
jgi:hypothetical protein